MTVRLPSRPRIAAGAGMLVLGAALASLAPGCRRDASPSAAVPAAAAEKSPREAWGDFVAAVEKDDVDAALGYLSTESRDWLLSSSGAPVELVRQLPDDRLAGLAARSGLDVARLRALPTGDLLRVLVREALRRRRADLVAARWKAVDVGSDNATVTLVMPDGVDERVALDREGGTWKIDLPGTRRLGHGRLARW